METNDFEVIIIGGSYSGLSAAMALGRSLRKVLVIDAGNPCNKQTPHSHNFLTQDGKTPAEISAIARKQVEQYKSIAFFSGYAVEGKKTKKGFEINTESGDSFTSKKLIFATGIKDIMPDIPGFTECWGISVIHCPYCHGYEVRNEKTGIISNGDFAMEYTKLINNWTKDLTLFTNGKSTLNKEQTDKITSKGIHIIESKIDRIEHINGNLTGLIMVDGTTVPLTALYSKVDFVQHSEIPSSLGCEFTDHGFIEADHFQKTAVPGVFSCGDNTSMFRAVSHAVASGTMAGAICNKELIDETF